MNHRTIQISSSTIACRARQSQLTYFFKLNYNLLESFLFSKCLFSSTFALNNYCKIYIGKKLQNSGIHGARSGKLTQI